MEAGVRSARFPHAMRPTRAGTRREWWTAITSRYTYTPLTPEILMRHLIIPALATVALAFASASAAEPFADLLKRVPDNANTLILVDLDALHTSAMGKKQGWAKQQEGDYYGGVSGIPPAVDQLLIASYLDPSTLSKSWDVTLARIDTATNATQLARKAHGSVDATNPELVLSPRNA